jgi:hypothetical protein
LHLESYVEGWVEKETEDFDIPLIHFNGRRIMEGPEAQDPITTIKISAFNFQQSGNLYARITNEATFIDRVPLREEAIVAGKGRKGYALIFIWREEPGQRRKLVEVRPATEAECQAIEGRIHLYWPFQLGQK